MPIFQTIAAACRVAGENFRIWKPEKATRPHSRRAFFSACCFRAALRYRILCAMLCTMLCTVLCACGAQRDELFALESESAVQIDLQQETETAGAGDAAAAEAVTEVTAGQNGSGSAVPGASQGSAGTVASSDTSAQAAIAGGSGASGASSAVQTCVVHICGAVAAPGVYELPAGSRIIDAVEAGGGFLPEADEACCNLAEEIQDGCQIYIATKQESCADGQPEKKAGIQMPSNSSTQTADGNAPDSSTPVSDSGLVNLNTADVTLLMTLPGIGESRAKAIISYREQHGAFGKIEDIMKISGIKQAAFSKIKDKITV